MELGIDTLRAAGFPDPIRTARELASLEKALGGTAAQALYLRALGAADPAALVSALERVGPALAEVPPSWQARAATLLEASDLALRVLRARPGLLRWLAGSRSLERPKSGERYAREAMAAVRGANPGDGAALQRRLRRYKYRELLRIMARDLLGQAPAAELGAELSHLAQALVRAALRQLEQVFVARYGMPAPTGFCVLGLGKLGGEDLNFSSDIDLIFLYRSEGEAPGGNEPAISNAGFFTKLGEALTQALSATTQDGFVYRVDLNLRPHGRSGALALGLPAMRAYYEGFGRTWERAALLKARHLAGDETVAAEFLEAVGPFVWRKSSDLSAVDGLRDLKLQIDLRGKASRDDIKLGPGGIREIEFFANALQLLHGGKNPSLRERNTLRALRKLEQAGLLAAPDTDALEEAYVFLRRLENHLQMVDERQTQELPRGPLEQKRIARTLGFPTWSALEAELRRHRSFVQVAFGTLLGQTARGELPDDPLLALALDPDASPVAREEALSQRGFFAPARALASLERLARVRESPFRQGAPGLTGLRLLGEVVRTPDPDQALFHLAEFVGSVPSPQSYFHLLQQLPLVGRRLLNLFGQSDYLSRYFLRHPQLVDTFVRPEDEVHKSSERIRDELVARVLRSEDPEERLSALRRYKSEETLRVGLGDISGELNVPQVARQLTAVADAALDQTLYVAEAEARALYGEPGRGAGRAQFAVIALGKLGGEELGYHSDLDLLFIYSGDGGRETTGGSRGTLTHHEYFAKIVQRLMTFLQMQLREGHLYKIDARLRPSGNQGPLVVSLEAFIEHHLKRGQLWERQALIKARGVAGDGALLQGLRTTTLDALVYERPLPADAELEIDRLRMRMERELAEESAEQLNAKTGHGGLVDVEFAVQALQLRWGMDRPSVRLTNTLAALEALEAEGVVTSADARTLRAGYLFHRGVENRLRLIHGYSLSHLPTAGRALATLARRLGYLGADPGPAFLAEYRGFTASVREVYTRLVRGSA